MAITIAAIATVTSCRLNLSDTIVSSCFNDLPHNLTYQHRGAEDRRHHRGQAESDHGIAGRADPIATLGAQRNEQRKAPYVRHDVSALAQPGSDSIVVGGRDRVGDDGMALRRGHV